jgi:hypothetical protein
VCCWCFSVSTPRNLEILIFSLFLKKVNFFYWKFKNLNIAKFSKLKLKYWLKSVRGQIFGLQFLFLKSSKILIFDKVMDICVNFFIFKIWTTLDSHNFGANYQNTHFWVFCCFWVGLHQFLSKKNFRKRYLMNFGGQQKC